MGWFSRLTGLTPPVILVPTVYPSCSRRENAMIRVVCRTCGSIFLADGLVPTPIFCPACTPVPPVTKRTRKKAKKKKKR